MPFYVGDYLRDTGHLTTEQHGAYILMIAHYWSTGGPLSDDDDQLAAITRLGPEKWERHAKILRAFFQPSVGVLRHKRIEAELKRAHQKWESLSQRGKKGAEARWNDNSSPDASANGLANASANAQEMPGDAPSPSSSPLPLETSSTSPPPAECVTLAHDAALIWNEEMEGVLPLVREPTMLTGQRETKACNLITKWLDGSLDQWRGYLRRIKASYWLTGQCWPNPEYETRFKANFDWAIKETSCEQVMEGKFDNEVDDVDDVDDDDENEDLFGDD